MIRAAMQNLQVDARDIPKDFGDQYGNLIQGRLVSPGAMAKETRPSSPNRSEFGHTGASYSTPVSARNQERRPSQQINTVMHLQPASAAGGKCMYVIEFKGGRNDFFVLPEDSSLNIQVGDLVIVEADRGKDLGKVIMDNVTHASQVQFSPRPDEDGVKRDSQPKLIYRHADPEEVNMLLDKARDEAKCLSVVQAKVRQKGLPMEVVDAEYQWDRRKLTFYFVSEQRIDFRDLVKDLFKIYKTRIWMCAFERSRTGVRLVHS